MDSYAFVNAARRRGLRNVNASLCHYEHGRQKGFLIYPSANCDLPLPGGFRLARKLVTQKRSSGCVAASLPSSRVSLREGLPVHKCVFF